MDPIFLGNGKSPGGCDDTGGFRERGLERREVEKRIYGVERRAAHGFRVLSGIKITRDFEHRINQMKTNIDEFMNVLTEKDETSGLVLLGM